MREVTIYESGHDGKTLEQRTGYLKADKAGQEMNLIQAYSDIQYQTVLGFGGALTPASALVYQQMDDGQKEETMNLLFGKSQLAYTCGRVSIGACDFSTGNYCYQENAEDRFAIDCDKEAVIPFLSDCVTRNEKLCLMASPWSPPSWMKTNEEMCHGGKLKETCRKQYAQYILSFLKAYQDLGIPIAYITVQNEPHAVQKWESCIYNSEEEKEFVRDFLGPVLKDAGFGFVKIIIWDHNKENVFQRTREICQDKEADEFVDGIAFHWYSGDHFENLGLCSTFFPKKELIFTEGCVELLAENTVMAAKANAGGNTNQASVSPWVYGECYGHDMIGNFNHGMQRFIDWNVILDEQGGPNHVGNFCSAPIIYHRENKQLCLQPSFYFISHFSRFVTAGSRRIAISKFTDQLEVTAFVTPDRTVVIVVMNSGGQTVETTIKDMESGEIMNLSAAKHSIVTLCYQQ